jgi:hypothetical protein
MIVRLALLLLGLFHLGDGLWMLAAPDAWYAAIPGVSGTGPINHHFIADIGLAFVASGLGLMLGARERASAGAFAVAGAAWPAMHALLHLWGWLHHGLPATTAEIVSTGVGVVLVGALGMTLAWLRVRETGGI